MRALRTSFLNWRLALLGVTVVGLAAAGLAWHVGQSSAQAPVQSVAPPVIPVTAGVAKTDNVPVYRTGLGTVQAFNTVTVKVRVDGQLNTVAFTEGQDVKANDVLAQIDPRPFQAALDQAKATQAKDEAQLSNAKLDLKRFVDLGRIRHQAKRRHAAGAGAPARGYGSGRRGRGRECAGAARLHHRDGPDLGPHWPSAGRCRQHRARGRSQRSRRHHPAPADLGRLHAAAGSLQEVIKQMSSELASWNTLDNLGTRGRAPQTDESAPVAGPAE